MFVAGHGEVPPPPCRTRTVLFMEVNYFHFRRHIHRNSHNMDLVCCLWLTQIQLETVKNGIHPCWATGNEQQMQPPHQPKHTGQQRLYPTWHSRWSVMEKVDLSGLGKYGGDIVSMGYPNIANAVHWGPAVVIHRHSDMSTYTGLFK